MKWVFNWCFAFCCVGSLAQAQTVTVRSADHETFTRIALDLPRSERVEINQEGKTILVDLPLPASSDASKSFFNRISRERVSSFQMSSNARQIKLGLACDCSYETFTAGANTVVIDIAVKPNDLAEIRAFPALETWNTFERIQQTSLGFEGADTPLVPVSDVEPPKVSDAQNLVDTRMFQALNQARDIVEILPIAQTPSETVPSSNEQMTFRSLPVSQAHAMGQVEQAAQENFQTCAETGLLNPARWPKYENAVEFLAFRRTQSVEQFEDFSATSARDLALTYLSLAMGAEARAILRSIENPNEVDAQLIGVAQFLDDDLASLDADWFDAIESCPDMVLWRMLKGAKKGDQGAVFNQMSANELKGARQQFEEWPSALKGIFGPQLARAFFDLGEPDAALFTLRKSEGEPSRRSGERELVAASISQEQGDAVRAIEILKPVAVADTDSAPEAVIALAKLVSEQGDALGKPEKAALETYQEELKGTALEPDLLRARIIAALQEEEFEAAISLIDEFAKLVRASKTNVVLDELGSAIFMVQSDATFLKEAVSLPSRYFNKIAEDTQTQIKARIVDLGFDELAAQLGQETLKSRDPDGEIPQSTAEQSAAEFSETTADNEQNQKASLTEDMRSDPVDETSRLNVQSVASRSNQQIIKNASPLS